MNRSCSMFGGLLDKAKSAAASGLESAKSAVNDKLEQRQNTKQGATHPHFTCPLLKSLLIDAWKAQVLVEGPQDTEFPQPQFRPFQEWADIFEPKASASTSGPVQKAIQNKLAESAQKAREMMLAQMQKLMIDRFMMTMFEVRICIVDEKMQFPSMGANLQCAQAVVWILTLRYRCPAKYSHLLRTKYARHIHQQQLCSTRSTAVQKYTQGSVLIGVAVSAALLPVRIDRQC